MANGDTGDIQDFFGASSLPTKEAQQQFNLEQILEDYISGKGKKDTSKQGGFLNSPIFDILGSIMTKDPMFSMKKQQFMAEMDRANQQAEDSKMTRLGAYLKAKEYLRGLKKQESLNQPTENFMQPTGELNIETLKKQPLDVAGTIADIFGKFKKEEPETQLIERPEGLWRIPKKGVAGKVEGVPGKEETPTSEIKNYQFDMKQRKDSGLGEITFKEWGEEKEEVKRLAAKEKTPPSAGNAVDLAIKRKFGTEYLTDPKKVAEADKWLATPEGRKAVTQARDDLTPPAINVIQTGEGLKTIQTKGTGIGTIKETGELPPMSEDLKKDYTATAQAYDLVNELKTQWDSFEHGGGTTGRVEATKTYMAALSGKHPNAKVYVSNREAFLGNLSRSLAAERGVLTQQDIDRIAKALPKIGLNAVSNDNKEEADKKWKTIYTIIGNAEKRLSERANMRKGEMKSIIPEKLELTIGKSYRDAKGNIKTFMGYDNKGKPIWQ
jgi:hypothetical protein